MIPLSTDRPTRLSPVVNYSIVFLNIAIFLLFELLPSETMESAYARFWFFSPDPEWWQFITSAFLHAGLMHLLGNMVFLWVFGNAVEDRLGHVGYALFYGSAAILSAVGHGVVESAPAVGASGAISAVAGAFLVLFPQTRVKILWIFVLITVINIPSLWFIGFNIARDFFGLAFLQTNVAYMAHLAGYAFGISTAFGLLLFHVLAREPYDLMTMLSQWNRRRQFKSATKKGFDPWAGIQSDEQRRRVQRDERERKTDRGRKRERDDDRGDRSGSGSAKSDEQDGRADALQTRTTNQSIVDRDVSDRIELTDEDREIMELRASISEAALGHDMETAAARYRDLLEHNPDAVLSRDLQLTVANQLMREGDHDLAAEAYRRLLANFPVADPHGQVRLVLGLLLVRYLGFGETEEARRTLEDAMERLPDGPDRELARSLMAEVGIASPNDPETGAESESESESESSSGLGPESRHDSGNASEPASDSESGSAVPDRDSTNEVDDR